MLWVNNKFIEWVHDPPSEAQHRAQEFWEKLSHMPFYADLNLTDPQSTIPLSWHCDGVKIFKTHKAWVYSFASCVRKGPSVDSKLLTLLFRDQEQLKPQTHDSIGRIIAYVMKWPLERSKLTSKRVCKYTN